MFETEKGGNWLKTNMSGFFSRTQSKCVYVSTFAPPKNSEIFDKKMGHIKKK